MIDHPLSFTHHPSSPYRLLHPVPQGMAALLEGERADHPRAGADRAAVPAGVRPCAARAASRFFPAWTTRRSWCRAGDDVGAAERVRQQLVEPDAVEDDRQHRVRAAAAAVAPGILRRLPAGRRRARAGGGRGRACSPRCGSWTCAASTRCGRSRSRLPAAACWARSASSPASSRTRSTSSRRSRTSSSCRSPSSPACSTRSIRCRRSGRWLSHLNPFFYMVDGFRYGFFGVSDVSPWLAPGDCRREFFRLIILHPVAAPHRLQAAALTLNIVNGDS